MIQNFFACIVECASSLDQEGLQRFLARAIRELQHGQYGKGSGHAAVINETMARAICKVPARLPHIMQSAH